MPTRRNFARRSGARPNRTWAFVQPAAFTVIPAASKVLLATFTASNSGIDETVLRCIGGVSVASDQSGANEEQIGAVGIIMVTDLAGAAGIASIPGASTDADDDGWFCHQTFAQRGSNGVVPDAATYYPIDTKGKRILEGKGMLAAVVAENKHATHGLQLLLTIRLLSQVRGTG